jgi:hypothetical protein
VRVATLRAVATLQRGVLRYWSHVSMLEADTGQQDMPRGIMARHGAGPPNRPPCGHRVAVGGTLRLVAPLQRMCGEARRPDGAAVATCRGSGCCGESQEATGYSRPRDGVVCLFPSHGPVYAVAACHCAGAVLRCRPRGSTQSTLGDYLSPRVPGCNHPRCRLGQLDGLLRDGAVSFAAACEAWVPFPLSPAPLPLSRAPAWPRSRLAPLPLSPIPT